MSDVQALVQLHFAERSVREERHFPVDACRQSRARPGERADGVMNEPINNQDQEYANLQVHDEDCWSHAYVNTPIEFMKS